MKKIQCDFSIGFDNEIEDIDMYPSNHLSKRMIQNILNDCVSDKSLPVGERCTGSVSFDMGKNIGFITSKCCVEVGEDWNKDKWSKNKTIEFPWSRIRV